MPLVDAGDVRLYVEEQGDGEPLLLIMGVGAQMTLWPAGFVELLVERGFRVIRFDNRDVGLSEQLDHIPPPSLTQMVRARYTPWRPASVAYDLHDMARDAVGVLDALGLPDAHVVGVSMGGMIAHLCAIEHASRVRTLTSIMSAPGDALSTTGDPRVMATLLSLRPTNAEEAGQARVKLAHAFNPGKLPLDEALIASLGAADYRRNSNPAGFARQFGAIMATAPRRAGLRTVRCPTHVIHGTHDPMIPVRGGRQTAQLVPGATLQLIDRMGHSLHPATWDEIVDGIVGCTQRWSD